MMNDLPRQKLRAIVTTHGRAVCSDPERFGALLAKVCPEHPRETEVLYHALDALLAEDSLGSLGERPWKSVADPVIEDLVTDHSITEQDASWATTSWGIALGEITTDQPDSPPPALSDGSASLASDDRRPLDDRQPAPWLSAPSPSIATKASPPGSFGHKGLLILAAVGGLLLALTLVPAVGPLKKESSFLKHPSSYWSQKLQEPIQRKEVWQGRVKIMKDVDPAADLHQPEAVPVLIDLLSDGNAVVRQKAVSILAGLGESAKPAIPSLQKALNDSDDEVRNRASAALQQLEAPPGDQFSRP
jgi:hypothetical protein